MQLEQVRNTPDHQGNARHDSNLVSLLDESLPKEWIAPFDLYYADFVANFIMFGIGYLAGLLIFRTKKKYPNLTIWTQDPAASAD